MHLSRTGVTEALLTLVLPLAVLLFIWLTTPGAEATRVPSPSELAGGDVVPTHYILTATSTLVNQYVSGPSESTGVLSVVPLVEADPLLPAGALYYHATPPTEGHQRIDERFATLGDLGACAGNQCYPFLNALEAPSTLHLGVPPNTGQGLEDCLPYVDVGVAPLGLWPAGASLAEAEWVLAIRGLAVTDEYGEPGCRLGQTTTLTGFDIVLIPLFERSYGYHEHRVLRLFSVLGEGLHYEVSCYWHREAAPGRVTCHWAGNYALELALPADFSYAPADLKALRSTLAGAAVVEKRFTLEEVRQLPNMGYEDGPTWVTFLMGTGAREVPETGEAVLAGLTYPYDSNCAVRTFKLPEFNYACGSSTISLPLVAGAEQDAIEGRGYTGTAPVLGTTQAEAGDEQEAATDVLMRLLAVPEVTALARPVFLEVVVRWRSTEGALCAWHWVYGECWVHTTYRWVAVAATSLEEPGTRPLEPLTASEVQAAGLPVLVNPAPQVLAGAQVYATRVQQWMLLGRGSDGTLFLTQEVHVAFMDREEEPTSLSEVDSSSEVTYHTYLTTITLSTGGVTPLVHATGNWNTYVAALNVLRPYVFTTSGSGAERAAPIRQALVSPVPQEDIFGSSSPPSPTPSGEPSTRSEPTQPTEPIAPSSAARALQPPVHMAWLVLSILIYGAIYYLFSPLINALIGWVP